MSLIALLSEKTLDTIAIFLNLLNLDLWPKIWSILGNVPCALEKKVHPSVFGWKVLKISVRSIQSNVSFKVCVSLLIICLDDLSIGVNGVLKVPYSYCVTINFSFLSVNVCLIYWSAPTLGALIFTIVMSSWIDSLIII